MDVDERTKAAEISKEVVRLLEKERKRKGYSKYRLAQLSGVSPQMLGYLERGLRQPSLETLLRLCGALEISLSKLIHAAEPHVRKSRNSLRRQQEN